MIKKCIIILAIISVISLNCSAKDNVKAVNNGENNLKEVVNTSNKKSFRALYIPYGKRNNLKYMKKILTKGKSSGIDMFVIDVHSRAMKMRVKKETIEYLKKENIFLCARVVCFPGGLNKLPYSSGKIKRILKIIKDSAEIGFDEIQLDYIRFQDGGLSYSLKRKYKFIKKFLKEARGISKKYNKLLSVDIFGRIVYNYNDNIGQKLEVFAEFTDVIYPMLYPSHFSSKYRLSHPGETIKEGILLGINRIKKMKNKNVKIQPWIQAFKYKYRKARVSYKKYIELQIRAAESTQARGWVAWNAAGNYNVLFKALKDVDSLISK